MPGSKNRARRRSHRGSSAFRSRLDKIELPILAETAEKYIRQWRIPDIRMLMVVP